MPATVNLAPIPKLRFVDSAGAPLVGGKLFTYIPSTTTKQNTYTDASGVTPNTNPIILDARGEAAVWPDTTLAYKYVLAPATDTDPPSSAIWTIDNVPAGNSLTADILTQLANTSDLTKGDALVGVKRNATGSVATTLHSWLEGQVFYAYDFLTDVQRADVRAGTLTYDLTTAYQSALSAAYAAGVGAVEMMDGVNRIDGTLSIPSGVTLYGMDSASEYYFGSPYGTVAGAKLYKTSANGSAGPIIELSTSSAIRGMYLHHDKLNGATTGIVRMGSVGTANVCYNAKVTDVRMYGRVTTDVSGGTTCYGIYFPPSTTPKQRYFNHFTGLHITNCDVAVRLNDQSNGNNFYGINTRQCYYHYQLVGGGSGSNQCVDNSFTGLCCDNIGVLPTTASFVFVLAQNCFFNSFTGYRTECNGSAFSIDSTCTNNNFVGIENETTASIVPVGNYHSRFVQQTNRDGLAQMLLIDPTRTTDSYLQGKGNRVELYKAVTGTLPNLNINAGTMTAADASCKKIITFDSTVYAKAQRPAFKCILTVFLNAPGGGVGEAIRSVEFWYRPTDNTTNAASFSVIRTDSRPAAASFISGLYFLTGVAAGSGFGIALVGGNLGAVAATHINVHLDVKVTTHDTNAVTMASYANFTFATAACTANDVTDSISLAAVADTVV